MREVQTQLKEIGFTAKFSATNRYPSACEFVSPFAVLIILQETRKCAARQRQHSCGTVRHHKRGPRIWTCFTRAACRSQNCEENARSANIINQL